VLDAFQLAAVLAVLDALAVEAELG